MWESLIKLYDNCSGQMCPVAHTYLTAGIGILLDKKGKFLCAKDVMDIHELIAVPCTVESGGRTSGVSPHLISDNLSYVGKLDGYDKRYDAYLKQLREYVYNVNDDYARAVYRYVKAGTVMDDINDIISQDFKYPLKSINIIFEVYGLPNEGVDLLWTDYYIKKLPKTGRCALTGELDYIPSTYPASILSAGDNSKLFMDGCRVGYIASQKIIHSIQWLSYAEYNKAEVIKRVEKA